MLCRQACCYSSQGSSSGAHPSGQTAKDLDTVVLSQHQHTFSDGPSGPCIYCCSNFNFNGNAFCSSQYTASGAHLLHCNLGGAPRCSSNATAFFACLLLSGEAHASEAHSTAPDSHTRLKICIVLDPKPCWVIVLHEKSPRHGFGRPAEPQHGADVAEPHTVAVAGQCPKQQFCSLRHSGLLVRQDVVHRRVRRARYPRLHNATLQSEANESTSRSRELEFAALYSKLDEEMILNSVRLFQNKNGRRMQQC